jgi:hypothetical protein
MDIIFTNVTGISGLKQPQPSFKNIPEWYKNTESYINGSKKPLGEGETSATIKRCMPVFDAITSGYLIYSAADVYVSTKNGEPWFEWSSMGMIGSHPLIQAPIHPANKGETVYPKWINFWGVKTPKGYSCLFTQPFHHDLPFTIFDGIVDTDNYSAPVNFPFVMNDINFEGLIPEGTPIAQVIPFKRESWKMQIGGEKEVREQLEQSVNMQLRFFDRYKNLFRSEKKYQ